MLELFDLALKVPQALGTTGAQMAGRLPGMLNDARADSLIGATSAARVVSNTIVDGMLIKDPNLSTVLRFVNQQIAVYWLQALAMKMSHGNVQISQILDSLNPNRDLGSAVASGIGTMMAGNNGFDQSNFDGFTLPRQWKEKPNQTLSKLTNEKLAPLTAGLNQYAAGLNAAVIDPPKEEDPMTSSSLHKDTIHNLQSMNNIAIGQLVDVTFKSGESTVVVPIQINLQVIQAQSDAIVALMAHAEADHSLKERFWMLKNGLITGTQFITCSDLIDQHAKMLRKDKSGIYADTLKRKNRSKLVGFISGIISLTKGVGNRPTGLSTATASQIYVIDKTTADSLEMTIGARLDDYRLRSRIFANTYIMMLVVYDPAFKSVKIYHRGIERASELDIDDVKPLVSKQGGGGGDMMQMLQAYQSGQMMGQPRF